MSITTILQIYKRPEYLQEQLKAIENQTIKSDRIIVVHNEGNQEHHEKDFGDLPKNIQYVYANPNMKYHLRFAVGLLADTEYVAFFDDDTMPQPRWYENCIETIKRHNCICGVNGRIVDRKNKTQYGPGWSNPSDNEVEVDFVGHAWFMKKNILKYMWYDDTMEFNNGEDIQLSANAKIFGNIPTYIPPLPLSDISVWGADPTKSMSYGSDKVASWIVNKQHNQQRFDLFDKYANKGWKLILER